MLFLVVLALALGTLRPLGGRFDRLAALPVRGSSLVLLALAVQVVTISVLRSPPHLLAAGLHQASYALAGVFLWRNRRLAGLSLLAAGGAANLLAIVANGGTMPARAAALRLAGLEPAADHFANSAVVAHPHLALLGDVFAVPAWAGPLANVFSPGDLALAAGAVWLVHAAAGCPWTRRGTRTGPLVPVHPRTVGA